MLKAEQFSELAYLARPVNNECQTFSRTRFSKTNQLIPFRPSHSSIRNREKTEGAQWIITAACQPDKESSLNTLLVPCASPGGCCLSWRRERWGCCTRSTSSPASPGSPSWPTWVRKTASEDECRLVVTLEFIFFSLTRLSLYSAVQN